MRRIAFTLVCYFAAIALVASDEPTGGFPVPRGLPKLAQPAVSPFKVELGKVLFSETKLSGDGTVSCASCHDPHKNFATNDVKAIGIRKQQHRRNAPALINRAFATSQFWDGRTKTLEEQALLPIADPAEMGNSVEKALASLAQDQGYRERFKLAFGSEEITPNRLAQALAAFERSLYLGNSPVDAFIDGEVAHLSEEAKHGLWIFESRGGCWKCHTGKTYSDESFHNTGISWGLQPLDLGRYEVTKNEADKGKFKTPTLRGVAQTAPYMHDGSLKTLEDVVAYYSRGGNTNPHLDGALKPLNLTANEQANLVAFLRALSEVVK
jgi:cytochrome c peroxidase